MKVERKEKQFIEQIVEQYFICDKCNKKINTTGFDAFDFELSFRTGTSYPECGNGELQEVHLCQNCAEALMEVLEADGYRINKSKWDW